MNEIKYPDNLTFEDSNSSVSSSEQDNKIMLPTVKLSESALALKKM